ncbi:Retrovirus-related Pol polyprotein from transposon RE1 [Vitis vinifera]|uniref:Retrovirus-related Pol polyprotein from transposon RE1 n=1 Tax=Vitis vinifera TaxID=29760 RepID=A0A438EA97_VITVI|nr:Retrovirus-related Pol polyprotein from transposon RE1 [Vitis vinifera]
MVQQMLISALSAMGFQGPDLSMVWHRRLGHPNTQILSHVLNSDLPGNKDRYSLSLECDSCKLDLLGSTFFALNLRSFRTFTEFLAYVDNQFSTSIKTLRTDSGGEYLSTEFQAFLASKGYNMCQKGFVCYDPTLHRTRISRNVIFFENQHFFPISSSIVSSSSTVVLPPLSNSSQIFIQSALAFNQVLCIQDAPGPQSLSVAHPISDPTTLQMQSVAAPSVRRSSRVSVPPNSYAGRNCRSRGQYTWDIEPCPPTIVPLGCKWVYSVKVRSDGSLDRYKARLVALGNNQEYGVNYEETFAPVAKMTTVRRASTTLPCFFGNQTWVLLFFLVYVDDIVITGSDSALLSQLKTHLFESFHMKDLGLSHIFLVLRCIIVLCFAKRRVTYLLIPVYTGSWWVALFISPLLDRTFLLLYSKVSQFLQTPRHLHLAAVRRIIRYVQGTSTRGLFFPAGNSTRLAAYSDADWAGCADTRRSITGWCVFLGDALISWKSKKQDRVSKSSTESEYWAMSLACSEIIWLRGLLAELDFSETDPTPLHADNTSAIQITANPVYHERTKHIEVDCHSIREAFEARAITLPHISTDLQIADIFTKALPRHRHCLLSSKLMLVDQPASI